MEYKKARLVGQMSEKEKPKFKLIEGGKEEISDKDFQIFLNALYGPYKGSSYNPE
jgi:hypothetical protein